MNNIFLFRAPLTSVFQLYFHSLKVQMKCFFIVEFETTAQIRKIAVYRFLISPLVPEL